MPKAKRKKSPPVPPVYKLTPRGEEVSHGLVDSGARTSSVTGALREPSTVEAGRYDLIPPEAFEAVACSRFSNTLQAAEANLANGLRYGSYPMIGSFIAYVVEHELRGWHRIAVHYARGALKYADRNWEKGLETGRTVSSLYRHLDKAKRGLVDEDHWAAASWNAIALINHLPRLKAGTLPRELDTYGLLARAGA